MPETVVAIVLAGGSGTRVQTDVNKVYLPVHDRELLEYSLETMDRSPRVSQIVLVVRESDEAKAEALIADRTPSKLSHVTAGGPSRHLSEMAGLESIRSEITSGQVDIVAIHDGARPFMTLDLLDLVIETALRHGGAVPGLEIEEPLYQTDTDRLKMLPQESLRRVQTPQAFRAQELLDAYDASISAGFAGVDTAETAERFSDLEVRVVPGDPRNIKVTFVEDLFAAEEFALEWDKGNWTRHRR